MPAPRSKSRPRAIWRPAPVAKAFETIFDKGYVAHAPIEPHAALADVRAGKATVWASTQTPFPTRDGIADALSSIRSACASSRLTSAAASAARAPAARPSKRRGCRRSRQAGAGRMDPRGRILLRHVRSRRGGEDQFCAGSGRQDLALGLSGVRRRRARRGSVLRHSEPAHHLGRRHVLRRRSPGRSICIRSRSGRGARPAPT